MENLKSQIFLGGLSPTLPRQHLITVSPQTQNPRYILLQEHVIKLFLFGREEEERVTSYSGHGESRISHVYYK